MIVVGVSDCNYREILSIQSRERENEVDWSIMFQDLKERGLSGVCSVVSDDHTGLVKALDGVPFSGSFVVKMPGSFYS
jgi:transposase-like protein